MNQKKRNNIFQYLQVLAFGLILVFSPCSVRNSLQEALDLEKTDVTNLSKASPSTEVCYALTIDTEKFSSSDIINTTPGLPILGTPHKRLSHSTDLQVEKVTLNHYQSPSTIKSKIPLYLLHQQFKTYLQA